MLNKITQIVVLSAVVLVASALVLRAGSLTPPPGPVGPTMRSLDLIESRVPVQSLAGNAQALHVIDSPGSYYLTQNITGQPGLSGILIVADDVTLDFNGHTLIGGPGSDRGVLFAGGATIHNVKVFNGSLSGWGTAGISRDNANVSNSRFEDLRLRNNGQYGIEMVGSSNVFQNCHVQGHGTGISAGGDHMVIDCLATDNSDAGILVTSGLVRGCFASGSQAGIDAGAAQVQGCYVRGNTIGITALSGTVMDSTARNNTTGIQLGGATAGGRAVNCSMLNNYLVNVTGGLHAEVRDCYVRCYEYTVGIQLDGPFSVANGNYLRSYLAHAISTTAPGVILHGNLVPQGSIEILDPFSTVTRNVGGSYQLAPGTDAGPVDAAENLTSPWGNVGY